MNHREQASDDPFGSVYSVTLPENIPFTGKYALFRPPGEGRVPNFEDNILIRRQIGAEFEVVSSTFVPFDDYLGMRLRDSPGESRRVLLYASCFLAVSVDGADTFDRPTVPGLTWRFGDFIIDKAYFEDERLTVQIRNHPSKGAGESLAAYRSAKEHNDLDVPFERQWEVRTFQILLMGGAAATLSGVERSIERKSVKEWMGVGEQAPSGVAEDPEALLKTDGTRLWARSGPSAEFVQSLCWASLERLTRRRSISSEEVRYARYSEPCEVPTCR
jgi:hypothetical protein